MPSSPSHPRRSLALEQSNPHCGLMSYQNMSLGSPYFRWALLDCARTLTQARRSVVKALLADRKPALFTS